MYLSLSIMIIVKVIKMATITRVKAKERITITMVRRKNLVISALS